MLKIVISGVVNACEDSALAKELKELVDSIRFGIMKCRTKNEENNE